MFLHIVYCVGVVLGDLRSGFGTVRGFQRKFDKGDWICVYFGNELQISGFNWIQIQKKEKHILGIFIKRAL